MSNVELLCGYNNSHIIVIIPRIYLNILSDLDGKKQVTVNYSFYFHDCFFAHSVADKNFKMKHFKRLLLLFVTLKLINSTKFCPKTIGEDCQCFDIIDKLTRSNDSMKGINVIAICETCHYIFIDQIAPNLTLVDTILCSESEELFVQKEISENFFKIFNEWFTREIIVTSMQMEREGAEIKNNSKISLLSVSEYFEKLQNSSDKSSVVKIENGTIHVTADDLLQDFQDALGISLRNNSIRELSKNLLQNLTALQGLDLSINEISSFPDNFFKNSSLQYLWISHNNFINIDE